jgi:hypothetical protein|tara:strand:+ start:3335 stop:4285 length:951 start_codon:yes stop_codon:yes gene_type:complete
MKRYLKGNRLEDHTLEDVIKAYGAKGEVEFVDKFFGEEEMNAILEACNFNPIQGIDRTLEHKVRIGNSTTKRADLTFQHEDELFYFEVMSQSGNGKWDDDHHYQILGKTKKLELEYGDGNVHTFAIAFKEFDASYLEDIQRMDNGYAVHLRFNDSGYFADVYGAEEKKTKKTIKLGEMESYGQHIMNALSFKNRRSKPAEGRYLYIGGSHPETEKGRYAGIELVMFTGSKTVLGIKIHSKMRLLEQFIAPTDNLENVISHMSEQCPSFISKNPKVSRGSTIQFDFNVVNPTGNDLQDLECIAVAFANAIGCPELLK